MSHAAYGPTVVGVHQIGSKKALLDVTELEISM